MIDSIYTAMSGLQGHQRALSTISHNVANMNTPGFRGSHVDFVDLITGGDEGGSQGAGEGTGGRGVDASHVSLDMRSGEVRQTDRDLDLAIDGDGFFVLQDETGALRYTRNGGFDFNSDGVLVGTGNRMKLMGFGGGDQLVPVSIDGLRSSAPALTTAVTLTGNLSSTDNEHTIDSLPVYDRLGGTHNLKLVFSADTAAPGRWNVVVSEGSQQLGNGTFVLENAKPAATGDTLKLNVTWPGTEAAEVTFKLDADTTGYSTGTTSTLALKKQDGRSSGTISGLTFDEQGVLKVTYSNGQSAQGPKIALAKVSDEAGLLSRGGAVFSYEGTRPPTVHPVGDGLRLAVKSLELSNVDLTSEFSALILMQRGYQASSQVASTANDMLQQLFEMKGRR